MGVQTEGIVLDNLTSDPGSPEEGQVWYNSTDKKIRQYVNGLVEEAAFTSSGHKRPVRITTTNSIANLSSTSATISGVTCVAGDRVLVANGASRDGVEAVSNAHNGIYEFGAISGGNGPLTRTTDANSAKKLAGMSVFCQGCGTYHNLSLDEASITLETTLLNFNSVASKAAADGTIIIDATGTRVGSITDSNVAAANKDGAANTASMRTLGTTSVKACAGNDSRLSDDRTASGLRSASTVVSVSAATAPTSGQILTASSSTLATWVTPSTGTNPSVQNVTATGSITTTSATDVAMTTMTITPGAGNYLLLFNCRHKNGSNSGDNIFSVYVNGSQIALTERSERVPSASNEISFALSAYLTSVGAGQAVEIRWRVSTNTGTVTNRELILMKAA